MPARRRPAQGGRRRRRHLRGQPQHQLHQRLLRRLPVLRVRPAAHRRRRLLALTRPGRRPRRGGVGARRHRGVHAGRHRPRAGGHRLLRPGSGGEEAGAGHARARVLPDGDRERVEPHRAVLRGLPDQGARVRPRHDPGDRCRDPRRRGPVGADQGQAADGDLDRDRQHCPPRGRAVDLDDDVRPRRQPAPLGAAPQGPPPGPGHGPGSRGGRLHRVRPAPVRAQLLADLPRGRRPSRSDPARQPGGPRDGADPAARAHRQHPDQLGQARRRRHPRDAERRRERRRRHLDGGDDLADGRLCSTARPRPSRSSSRSVRGSAGPSYSATPRTASRVDPSATSRAARACGRSRPPRRPATARCR